jgi:uncharacterized protein
MITTQQKKIIQQILAPFEPTQIGIFGSHARREATATSDLDILVDFNKKYSLFDLLELEEKLAEALPFKIDLVTGRSLNPAVKNQVDKEVIFLD